MKKWKEAQREGSGNKKQTAPVLFSYRVLRDSSSSPSLSAFSGGIDMKGKKVRWTEEGGGEDES